LRSINADWFEAVGTWVGVIVSTTAVVLAVLVFRSEEFARRRADLRQIQRELDAAEAAQSHEQVQADAIRCDIRWSSGDKRGDGRFDVDYVRVSVQNNTTDTTVTEVCLRSGPVFADGEDWHLLTPAVRPGEQWSNNLQVRIAPVVVSEDSRELREGADFGYQLDGVVWGRRPDHPAVRGA